MQWQQKKAHTKQPYNGKVVKHLIKLDKSSEKNSTAAEGSKAMYSLRNNQHPDEHKFFSLTFLAKGIMSIRSKIHSIANSLK